MWLCPIEVGYGYIVEAGYTSACRLWVVCVSVSVESMDMRVLRLQCQAGVLGGFVDGRFVLIQRPVGAGLSVVRSRKGRFVLRRPPTFMHPGVCVNVYQVQCLPLSLLHTYPNVSNV